MLSLCQGLTGVAMSKRTSHHSVDFRKTIATCTGSTASFAEASFVVFWVRSKFKVPETFDLEDLGRPWQESWVWMHDELWMDHGWYCMDGQVFHPSFMDVQRSSLDWLICVYRAQVLLAQGMCLETNQTWNSEVHGTGPQWMAMESIPTNLVDFVFVLGRFKRKIK